MQKLKITRLRRTSTSFEEASADLGAHSWQTFRFVTLRSMRTALADGALLSFDEDHPRLPRTRLTREEGGAATV
jgi:hypothetical protein